MNAEEYVTTALRVAADVEPDPRGLTVVQAGIERRSRRARRLVPLTAAAVVLSLVAGVAALTRVDEPSVYQPARRPGDLYLEGGSIWPFQSRAAAKAWRRDPERAPYLRDPVATVREFTRTQLGRDVVPQPFILGPDSRMYYVPGPPGSGSVEVGVSRAPGSDGPWVVTSANDGLGLPRTPRPDDRWIASPAQVSVTPLAPRHRVAVLEPVGDGTYDVLGEAFPVGDPPSGFFDVSVEFRKPRGGFGVVAVYGMDAGGAVQRGTMIAVSFRDPWPDRRSREPRPDSWPRIEFRDGVVTVRHDGPPYVVPPGPLVTGVVASGKDRFGILGRRTGPCTGRLDEIVTTGGPVKPLLPVDGVPASIAARDDRIAFTVTRCGTKDTALVTVVGGAARVIDSTGDIRSIGWHPTEDRIVYLDDQEVVTVNADGSGRTVLPLRAEAVTWRPGATPALVTAVREPDGVLVVSHTPDGRNPERLSVPLPVQRVVGIDYDQVGTYLAITTPDTLVTVYESVAILMRQGPFDAPVSW